MSTLYRIIESPVRQIMLVGSEEPSAPFAICGLYLVGQKYERPIEADWKSAGVEFGTVVDQLSAYFAGEPVDFDTAFTLRGSDFQRRVWRALIDIPYGTTVTYGALAERVAGRVHTRAVAAAVGRNPISIAIPCHRVIGANGALTGYAGGLDRKRWLLDHEAVVSGSMLSLSPLSGLPPDDTGNRAYGR
jgi:methylated-DNA-[protein]-cysteine S-methyltransferase